MSLLQQFAQDEALKEELKNFVIKHIEKKCLDSVFTGKDITGFRNAKEIIVSAFSEIDATYKVRKEQPLDTAE